MRGEISAITLASIELDGPRPAIHLEARHEKARRGAVIPLRADLVEDLRDWISFKLERARAEARRTGQPSPVALKSEEPLVHVPQNIAGIMERDLKRAGVPRIDSRDRVADFHSLRVTFGTLLAAGGVGMRTAQAALRHSDPRLTAATYTDPRLLDVTGALETLPDLPLGGDRDSEAEVAAATGTGGEADRHVAPLPPGLPPTPVLSSRFQSSPVTSGEKSTGRSDWAELPEEGSNQPLETQEGGGGGRIRTPGDLRHAGFQNRCIRPLCHASVSAG